MEIDLFSLPLLPAGPVPDRLAWAYLLRCADGSLYAGWTSDLARRVAAHTAGKGGPLHPRPAKGWVWPGARCCRTRARPCGRRPR